jgi:hypothetical protein
MTSSQKNRKTHKKSTKNSQKTLKKPSKTVNKLSKTLQKSTKNPNKNPQEKQKVISLHKNIIINVDIAMRKGGIHSLGQLLNTISFLNEIGKV